MPAMEQKANAVVFADQTLINLHNTLSGNEFYSWCILKLFYRISARMSPIDGDMAQRKMSVPYKDEEIDPLILSRFLGHLIQVEVENLLRSIPNETLILWGALDSFVQSEWGDTLNYKVPNSHCLEMYGEYHNIATVRTNILASIITEFIT